jgi:hypothetical protein
MFNFRCICTATKHDHAKHACSRVVFFRSANIRSFETSEPALLPWTKRRIKRSHSKGMIHERLETGLFTCPNGCGMMFGPVAMPLHLQRCEQRRDPTSEGNRREERHMSPFRPSEAQLQRALASAFDAFRSNTVPVVRMTRVLGGSQLDEWALNHLNHTRATNSSTRTAAKRMKDLTPRVRTSDRSVH